MGKTRDIFKKTGDTKGIFHAKIGTRENKNGKNLTEWQSTPVFLPGESHGRRSLVSYSPRGRKEWDVTERFHLTSPWRPLDFLLTCLGNDSLSLLWFYTVKGFSVVNEAEVDIFLEFSCFSYGPRDVGNLISSSSVFSKSSLKIR